MKLKEMKRKLSAILGINLFDAKYSKQIDEVLNTVNVEEETEEVEQEAETPVDTNESNEQEADNKEENSSEEESVTETDEEVSEEEESENGTETEEETKEEEVINEDVEDATDSKNEEVEAVETEQVDTLVESENNDELFNAKLEASLLRTGIREDRLEAAIKLFKVDHSINDINQVSDWIKNYPEWKAKAKSKEVEAFGMAVGEAETGETAEERRLRQITGKR